VMSATVTDGWSPLTPRSGTFGSKFCGIPIDGWPDPPETAARSAPAPAFAGGRDAGGKGR
jgi:hypothetical protein